MFDEACSTHSSEKRCLRNCGQKTEKEKTTWLSCAEKDTIKVDV